MGGGDGECGTLKARNKIGHDHGRSRLPYKQIGYGSGEGRVSSEKVGRNRCQER